MTISTALSPGITSFFRDRGRPVRWPTPGGRRSSRPRVEVLEDRTLLSTDIVTNTNDSGPGSLRDTISSASAGDTIAFASGVTGTITLTSDWLDITQNLDFEGPGAGVLTISGGDTDLLEAFRVEKGVTATITGLSIADSSFGGMTNYGTLAITNSTISGNSLDGGIFNEGTLTVTDCTISGNSSGYGGGIRNDGTLTLTDSTLSGNTASYGGGIFNNGAMTLKNCTISGNAAGVGGGGIDNNSDNGTTTPANTTLANTIVAINTAPTQADIYGSVTSKGYNLIGNSSGVSGFVATDLLNVKPLLGPLQNNGGPTETMALLPGSPAIAAGSVALIPPGITTDQRGAERTANDTVDIGAFEVQVYSVYLTADDGGGSLRSALANANQFGGSVITFTASGLIRLTSPLPAISSDVQILGPGASNLTVSGNHATTVFVVNQGVTATIAGLTIADGYSDSGAAGGIYNLGALTVTNCTLSDNSAPNGSFGLGGGIANQGTLTVTNCTLSGNSAVDGGGIANISGTLTVTNSTLSGNSAGHGGFGGGGIFNADALTVTNCNLSDNSANDSSGGGIDNYSGTLTLTNCTLSGNSAFQGGGIDCNGGMVAVTSCNISHNSASQAGGGIYNGGTLTVTNSTLSGNSIDEDDNSIGGGIANLGTLTVNNSTLAGNSASEAGGGVANEGTLTVTNSTLSDNSSGSGGGIFNNSTLTVTNSTIAGNSATFYGGGIYSNGTLTVTNSTVAGNSAPVDGGGIAAGGTLTLANTIVATNSAETGADLEGAVTSKGYNLIGNSSGGSGFTATDLLNLNPLLGPLQNNGGPTETMALLSGSPAIAAGNINRIPSGITTDQRGSARVVNGTVDIGAFESRLKPSAPTIIRNRPADHIFKPSPDFATMGPAHSFLEAPPCLCLPATTIGRPWSLSFTGPV